jgi:hypothetical protein
MTTVLEAVRADIGIDASTSASQLGPRGSRFDGGEGGIRTPDTVARMPHFECGAFNHSATSPNH